MRNETSAAIIDRAATADAVRARYGSVQRFCHKAKIHPDTFYKAVRGERGKDRRSTSASVLRRLRRERLLRFTD